MSVIDVLLLRELAGSGVVHEAEPPGIDYVTIQVDMHTWEKLKERVAHLFIEDEDELDGDR